MKALEIYRISDSRLEPADIERRLAGSPHHAIDVLNWPQFDYCPRVTFSIGYGGGDLCVRFAVEEDSVLAERTETNASVCRDSCVEMFIAPSPGGYFNFEFNCIGTTLVGCGNGRGDIQYLDPDIIARIRRQSSLGSDPFSERLEPTAWHLTAAIPLEIMGISEEKLPGHICSANFYKCGDCMSKRHYLTWNPVDIPAPDFHRPDHFGRIEFL